MIQKMRISINTTNALRSRVQLSIETGWNEISFSKLLRYITDERFDFSISKLSGKNMRQIYIYCKICKSLVLSISFSYILSKIIVQLIHIYAELPIIKKDSGDYFLYFQEYSYSSLFKSIGKIFCRNNSHNLELNHLFLEKSFAELTIKLKKKISIMGHNLEEFINIIATKGDVYLKLSEINVFPDIEFSKNSMINDKYLYSNCLVAPWDNDVLKYKQNPWNWCLI